MILSGILHTSLGGFTVIRGVAPLGELERCSEFNPEYQRNLIDTHKAEIERFLADGQYLFFPEVILSASLQFDFNTYRGKRDITPIVDIHSGAGFTSNVNGLSVRTVPSKLPKALNSVGGVNAPRLAYLDLPDNKIESGLKLFRIDGNHRLCAVNQAKPGEPKYNLPTPFCIVLHDDASEAERFEKVVFHNINAKQIPLSSEENLRLILEEGDGALFDDRTLLESPSFGPAYYLARKLLSVIDDPYLEALKVPLKNRRSLALGLTQFLIGRDEEIRQAATIKASDHPSDETSHLVRKAANGVAESVSAAILAGLSMDKAKRMALLAVILADSSMPDTDQKTLLAAILADRSVPEGERKNLFTGFLESSSISDAQRKTLLAVFNADIQMADIANVLQSLQVDTQRVIVRAMSALDAASKTQKDCFGLIEAAQDAMWDARDGRKAALDAQVSRLLGAFQRVNELYRDHVKLAENGCHGVLISFLYFALHNQGCQLGAFSRWVTDNRIDNLSPVSPTQGIGNHYNLGRVQSVDATSLVSVFESILTARHREIFISMAFREETIETYKTIKKIVNQINEKHRLDIRLREIRIDDLNKGYSYTITDEILKVIEGSGLLIADLTFGNRNVYHEIGYLMGLNRGKGRLQENFILIADKNTRGDELESDIGFNLKSWKQLRFISTRDLEVRLTDSIERFYGLSASKKVEEHA